MKKLFAIFAISIFLYGVNGVFKVYNYFGMFDKKEINLGVTTAEKIEELKTSLETIEETYKTTNGKYQQKLLTTDTNSGSKYEIHEYVTSKGETGYQILLYNTDGSVESKGYGIEALSRTYTIPVATGSPSSTPE